MKILTAHFDGKVLVLGGPVELPVDCALKVQVEPLRNAPVLPAQERPLVRLLRALEDLPQNSDWPVDGAAQHDHYLYGASTATAQTRSGRSLIASPST